MTKTIADLAVWPEPNSVDLRSAASMDELLLDGLQSTPVASIRGMNSVLEIHCTGDTMGYAVMPRLTDGHYRPRSSDRALYSHAEVALFERANMSEPFSQVYARALLWATRQMTQELEEEEI